MCRTCLKRMTDLALAVPALILLLPLLTLLAALVWIKLGRPVMFVQQRPGLGGKPFKLYKFRTMTDTKSRDGRLLPDGERLTPLGRVLRRTSLDELPALYNVIRGDLSLVGPRPLLMRYLPYYTEREHLRHTVKPGITGWAQIHGRNYLPWNERLACDVWYVENWSFWLDIKILIRTVVKVVTREGVSPDPDKVESDLDLERMRCSQPVTELEKAKESRNHSAGEPI